MINSNLDKSEKQKTNLDNVSPIESLRLMKVFLRIDSHDDRLKVIALAEGLAAAEHPDA